ncbi:PAS-domain containing protein [Roseomonas sp. GCM10028921]
MTAPELIDDLARSALDALPAGIAVLDAEGRLIHANPAFRTQAGAPALAPGATLEELIALLAGAGHLSAEEAARFTALPAGVDAPLPGRLLARSAEGHWHEMAALPVLGGGTVLLSVDVTALRGSEAEALEHAGMLETILERLDTGVLVSDGASRLVYFNRAYHGFIGTAPGTVRPGMTRAELFETMRATGELFSLTPEELETFQTLGVREVQECWRRRPDGSVLWVRAHPLPDAGVLTEVHDVTALHRAEQAAQDRAALLDGVLAALPHGVCVYGPDGRARVVNAAYQRIMAGAEVALGDELSEVLARRVASGEYASENDGVLRRADAGPGEPIEQTRVRPNGTVISARLVTLPDGGRVAVVTDVTRRAQAEAEAGRRTATLQAMLDNQPDGVALFDAQGYLIAANALAGRMTGLGEEDLRPGRHLIELRARQAEAREINLVEGEVEVISVDGGHRALGKGGRYLRRRPDGTILEVRTDLTPDGGFIRTYRDVTEERRIRAELEAARDAAEAASRAKSGFLATMTHELRTPLHAVIGFSEAILEESRPEVLRDHAQEILAAGQQLLELVDGLLEATRIEAGSLSLRGDRFDPAPVLRAAAARARKAAEDAGIEFRTALPDELPLMRGDEARLRQVLDALLSNACKFTPGGGRVAVSAEPVETGGTVITISDTGIGMAPEDIPRAFEAFTQLEGGLSRRFPGSGLGLYLARALAGAMGIALALDSTPGQGTTARLTVPPAERITA